MPYQTIDYEKKKNIVVITLNRPESMNALSDELLDELNLAFERIAGDTEIAAVIITGSEKVFAAGADIGQLSRIDSPAESHQFVTRAHAVFNKIEAIEKPVIAAVSGIAMGGGCELALACDIRLAAENALFGLPEIKIGVIPGAGGTQRLPRLIGLGRAKEMLFSGDPIDAKEAYRIGLANRVFPPPSLMAEAIKMAQKFVERPQLALRANKTAVTQGINMDLHSALCYEARCFEILFSTQDLKEGMQAFIEKRKPAFTNK